MRRSRLNEAQIIGILKQAEAGVPGTKLARQHGVSEQTIYRWKKKYGGMNVGEARRLHALEEENRTLKHLLVEEKLDNYALKVALEKN